MIVRQNHPVQPWRPIRRAALIGGITVAEAAMLIVAAGEWGSSLLFFPLGAVIVGGIGAGLAALIAYSLSLRQGNSLGDLERDLAKAAAIYERGLTDEAEYGRIKGQILETYRYTRGSGIDVARIALRASLVGLLVPAIYVLSMYQGAAYLAGALAAGAVGALLSGIGTAAVMTIRRKFAERQLGEGKRPMIDSGV